MPHTPEQSHNAKDHVLTEMGFMKKPEKGADGLAPEKNPDVQAQVRVKEADKKAKALQSAMKKANERPFWPTKEEMAQAREALTDSAQAIVEKAKQLQPFLSPGVRIDPGATEIGLTALSAALATLRAEPAVREKPTKELLDSLVTIGKVTKENADPAVQAQVQELRALVIEMQGKLAAQPASVATAPASVIVNNNFGPQGAPQAPAQAPEKKEEQTGWKGEAYKYMVQVQYVQTHIDQLVDEFNRNKDSADFDKKGFEKTYDRLKSERDQLLRTVNAIVENARKPSDDRNLIAATRQETDEVMQTWVTQLKLKPGGFQVRNGAYKLL